MGVWKFSSARSWFMTDYRTPITPIETEVYKEKEFRWPEWAISLVRDLGSSNEAIQTVSKLLDKERKENFIL